MVEYHQLEAFFSEKKSLTNIRKLENTYSINGSPYLTVGKINTWLRESFKLEIEEKILNELLNNYAKSVIKEDHVQQIVAKRFNGQREVILPVGRIDVLNDEYLIECKRYKDWKGAIGQLISYSAYYPKHKLVLYLFDDKSVKTKNFDEIIRTCSENNIKLIFELV